METGKVGINPEFRLMEVIQKTHPNIQTTHPKEYQKIIQENFLEDIHTVDSVLQVLYLQSGTNSIVQKAMSLR